MKTLLLVYASQSGHTLALVTAAAAAAGGEDNVAVRLLPALDAGIDDLLACHALVLATPENFGYMAGTLKDFLDRTFYPAQGKVAGLPYAVIISAGNDGQGALSAIRRIASGYPLHEALPPVLVKGEVTEAALAAAAELGATLAAALSIGAI
ncbi:flavodoxin family protein [Vogesella sp. GCM10023246]|uniref:NAD(P)H-dependent oxidoreductase n=1 Tax=Vogesella oryzagri TaxID=3160864 RepID=A0ABV1M5K8_9NEIS